MNNYTYQETRVKVQENRAPTDESIKILRELEQKTVENVLAHIEVEYNAVKAQAWVIDEYWKSYNGFTIVFKFNINGRNYHITKVMNDKRELLGGEPWDTEREIFLERLRRKAGDYTKAILTYYVLKNMVPDLYEQFMGEPVPDWMLKNYIHDQK